MIVRIKNWKRFQHYKDRRPPWIKLHFQLLTSKDWACASNSERVLAVACMLIASQSDNQNGAFEADPEYFRRVAFIRGEVDFKPLINRGFLEVLADDSNLLADATKCSSETYKEEKESTKTPLPPADAGEETIFDYRGTAIAVKMGRHKRLPTHPSPLPFVNYYVEFLNSRGFPARVAQDD